MSSFISLMLPFVTEILSAIFSDCFLYRFSIRLPAASLLFIDLIFFSFLLILSLMELLLPSTGSATENTIISAINALTATKIFPFFNLVNSIQPPIPLQFTLEILTQQINIVKFSHQPHPEPSKPTSEPKIIIS